MLEDVMRASFKDDSLRALIYNTKKAFNLSEIMTGDVIKTIETELIELLVNDPYLRMNEENTNKIAEKIKNELKTTPIYAKILFNVFVGWLISKNITHFECFDGKSNIVVVPFGQSIIAFHYFCKERRAVSSGKQ